MHSLQDGSYFVNSHRLTKTTNTSIISETTNKCLSDSESTYWINAVNPSIKTLNLKEIHMKTEAFVYKWTHIPSLNWYVGSRTSKGCNPQDGYICSSKTVKPMIESNPNEWIREIIATGDPKEMREFERVILMTFNAISDHRSFNRSNAGGVGRLDHHTPESKEKISKAGKGKKHAGSFGNRPAWNKGKTGLTNIIGTKVGTKRPGVGGVKKGNVPWNKDQTYIGTPCSEEKKQKIIEAKKKKPWTPTEEQRARMVASAKNRWLKNTSTGQS